DPHSAFLKRDGGGGPAELAQDAELTEELRLIQRRVEHPVPGDGERAHLDPTRPQEQQLTGLVALMKEVGAPSVVADVPPGRELLNVTGPHRPHERCFGHGSDERGKVATGRLGGHLAAKRSEGTSRGPEAPVRWGISSTLAERRTGRAPERSSSRRGSLD